MPTLPNRNPTMQTLQRQIADIQRELRILQEKPQRQDIPLQRRTEVIFSYHGEVLPDDPSGPYLMKDFTATIHRLDITARVPGYGPCTFQVLVDGAVAYEDNFPIGETHAEFSDLAIEVEEYSTLAVNWPVTAGLETVVMTFQVVAVEGEEYD